ncbi:MAG: IMS domain-containing protein [Synechococcus sp.]|nr:IMS domain-containing protein [Synechococcus sp.]
MELPIDHFRLLGVSPSTDAQTVLRTLQQRLDRPPDQGFTHECLEARAQLLRTTADLLTDEPRRRAYEEQLLSLETHESHAMAALEVASSHEVGGLLLLLEAGQPLEVFEQAERCLQPPRAPSLGSGREADLTLLAGLASQQAAAELRQHRRYEAASQVLARGLQLLQRMGQCAALRERMAQDRDALLPYRVLDLLSRDLACEAQRQEGLALLEQLVQLRGGFDATSNVLLRHEEFQAFFGQIRSFLTLQEQLDLFAQWAQAGSLQADLLAGQALTASGFAQRKPERIAAALERLSLQGSAERPMEQACLLLLLGDVDRAEALFRDRAPEEVRRWAASQGEDLLAQLCAVCRDWLTREVLRGYRDLEGEADLEAYFADRDVQAFVERQDRIRRRAQAAAPRTDAPKPDAPSPEAPTRPSTAVDPPLERGSMPPLRDSLSPDWDLTRDPLHAFPSDLGHHPLEASGPVDHPVGPAAAEAGSHDDVPLWSWPDLQPALAGLGDRLRGLPSPWFLGTGLALAAALVATGWWLWRPRPQAAAPPQPPGAAAKPPPPVTPPKPVPAPVAAPAAEFPLQAPEPSEAQVRALLEAWLTAKAAVLAAATPAVPLEAVASSSQAAAVLQERRRDEAREQRQKIDVQVLSSRVKQSSPEKIVLAAELRYSDQLLAADGSTVSSTAPFSLTNTYVFTRQNGAWRLVSFYRGG